MNTPPNPLAVVYWSHTGEPIDYVIAGIYLVTMPVWYPFVVIGWAGEKLHR